MNLCAGCGSEEIAAEALYIPAGGCVACGAVAYQLCHRCALTLATGHPSERSRLMAQIEFSLMDAEGSA